MPVLAYHERMGVKSKVATALANLQSIHLFWSPSQRRLYARGMPIKVDDCYRCWRGRGPVPKDAEYLGTYHHGDVTVEEIVQDIEALPDAPWSQSDRPEPRPRTKRELSPR